MQSQLNFGHGSRTVGLRLSLFPLIGVNSSAQKMGFHALTIHFLVVSNQTDQFLDWPVLTYLAYFAQELQLISIGFPARFFQKKVPCQLARNWWIICIYSILIFLRWQKELINNPLLIYRSYMIFHRPTQLAIYVNHIYFTDVRLGTIPKWHQISDWDSETTAKTICLLHHAWPLLIDLPQRIRIRNATHVEVLVR